VNKLAKNDKKFDGYEKAKEFDKRVGILLENNPITQENAKEWWKFARTVKTSMELIEHEVIECMTEKVVEEMKVKTTEAKQQK
jgi:hypothetical protein